MDVNSIKDNKTRYAIQDIDKKLKKIELIRQLPADASLKDVIDTINKITNSMKRR
jgi:hypothetical protein